MTAAIELLSDDLWSPQQTYAMGRIENWLRSGEPIFRLFGFAGTGKTSLARHFAGQSHRGRPTLFAAYTGKAASVLRRKGCSNACTIHRLIYKPVDVYVCPDHPRFEPKAGRCVKCGNTKLVPDKVPHFVLNHWDSPLIGAGLLIVDEVSMVDAKLAYDLLSFNVPILTLGDPFQLPPVNNEGGFFTNHKPDVMLTEIHRQARDNPIIRMSLDIREGKQLANGNYGQSKVIKVRDIDLADYPDAQILCGRNEVRHHWNDRRRATLGFDDPLPVVGDRLVCMRNCYEKGLLNGTLWDVEEVITRRGDDLFLKIKPDDGGDSVRIRTHAALFRVEKMPWHDRDYDLFNFGYALTVHKAQGSQWDEVLLLDESSIFHEYPDRWLYTGITRAAEKITIVRFT